ncbi:DNA glycosylase, partial [Ramicandelaber brevisporus]
FEELLTTIVYQQLHGKAAASIYRRVLGLFGIEPRADSSVDGLCPTPEMVLTKSKTELRSAGLSEKKAEYMLGLASAFNDGTINPDEFGELTDEELMNKLVALKGIGAWTVHMFMMFYLRRPDVLPVGDLGVQRGMCELFKQPNTEEEDEEEEKMTLLAEPWRPYRSYAAWYMWRLTD